MDDCYKISVIIPTYNRANFLEKTLNSILSQTTQSNEIIVVDDGSTDQTKSIISKYDIKYIYQSNKGVSSARNQGIKIAKYPWIAFCDSDDIWHKDKLEKQILFHKQNPNIFISHTNETWLYNNKIIKKNKHQQKPHGYCFVDNLKICKIGASTVLIKKDIFTKVGLFDETLIACEDYDMWLRILETYPLGYINQELITKVAGHSGQLSFETKMLDTYRIEALQKHLHCQYKQEVIQEILYKIDIILKGAYKHKNQTLIDKYTKLQKII